MGLSIYNIKKWTYMLAGKSIQHVNQDMGQLFIPGEIKGYFNNLTEKVLKDQVTLDKMEVPISSDEKAGEVLFPIAIFQYGLGAYDLFLKTHEEIYYKQFMNCVNWAVDNQKVNGAWDNFGFIQPEAPYSAMCQGEGASLLIRAYVETKAEQYLEAAKNAVDFMLVPLSQGGTALYTKEGIVLYEYTNKPCVLNGWIFSLFGLYDLSLVSKDNIYEKLLKKTVAALNCRMGKYDCGYWSYYDDEGTIASPFYHNLHIAQLEALEKTFGLDCFKKYKQQFIHYRKNRFYYIKAFLKKAYQKIKED